MTVYLVGEFEVTNPAGLEPYRRAVNDTIAKYGGRFLVRTSTAATTKLLEGGPEPKTVVIIEFPDSTAIERWWNSPEYQRILPIRLQNCAAASSRLKLRGDRRPSASASPTGAV
jgi:uncharacterized protein (DUF1330 family)